MIRLLPNPIRKPEAVEDLQRPALQPVRLAVEDLRATLVHDTCVDAAVRHPSGQHQTVF